MLVNALILLLTAGAAAQFYSLDSNFQISTFKSPNELGHVTFDKTYRQTGWNKLYVYTSPNISPIQQHRAAGYLQGYATYAEIYSAYLNYIKTDLEGHPYAPADIQKFIDDQFDYMDYMVKTNPNDIFWTYTGYYLEQFRYLHVGYLARVKAEGKKEMNLDFKMIYLLPYMGDLEDFIAYDPDWVSIIKKNCNAYIKWDGQELYSTHQTQTRYTFMLRIYKHWNFPRQNVASQFVSFTSRPADMISKDDFFVLGSGLKVLQTTLVNFDDDNMNWVKPNTVPSWVRTVVANHLSHNISQWVQYFNTSRSGTHNNQWVIVNPSKLNQSSGLVAFFQEAFQLTNFIDLTKTLKDTGYVASYNIPYSMDLYYKLGYKLPVDPTYETDVRYFAFQRYHPKITNLDSMKFWLMYNDEKSPELGIGPRYDLTATNKKPFGASDCKIASQTILRQNYFWAIAGPTTSNGKFPNFDWRTWEDPKTSHIGHVDLYNFTWIKITIDLDKDQLNKKLTEEQDPQ